jgi:DNA-binding GntR family transcriptional regulator
LEDPRRYVRAMDFIRTLIENGSYKPHELIPSIQQLADQTGHSRHTIGKALRLLQDQGLVDRTPGLGYCATGRAAVGKDWPTPIAAATGQYGSRVGWGLGGATRGDR